MGAVLRGCFASETAFIAKGTLWAYLVGWLEMIYREKNWCLREPNRMINLPPNGVDRWARDQGGHSAYTHAEGVSPGKFQVIIHVRLICTHSVDIGRYICFYTMSLRPCKRSIRPSSVRYTTSRIRGMADTALISHQWNSYPDRFQRMSIT